MARSDSSVGERIRIALGVSVAVFAISLSYWGIYVGQQSEAATQEMTTINFDDKPSGQISGTTYPDLDIRSNGQPRAELLPIDNPNCPGFRYPSSPNALYIPKDTAGGNSILNIAFAGNKVSDTVSLQLVHFSTTVNIKVEALDSSGAVIDTKITNPPGGNGCANTPFTFSAGTSTGIASLRIAAVQPEASSAWGVDDLSFSTLHQPIINFNFSATPLTGTAPLTITATYTGQGSATPLNWDFGDGQVVQNGSATVQHTYQAAGTYAIKLTSNALTATKSITVTTATPLPPTLLFSTSKSVYTAGEQVAFSLTNQGPGSVELPGSAPYSIRSQDGLTSFSPISSQAIITLAAGANQGWTWDQKLTTGAAAPVGTYTVTVRYLESGVEKTKATTFTIAPTPTAAVPAPTIPTFTFAFTPTSGSAPLTVQGTISGEGTVSPTWDFGDGTTLTGTSVSHTYTAAGTYTATVRVGTQVGTQTITVSPAPVVATPTPTVTTPTKLVQTGPTLSATLLIAFLISALLSYFIIRRPFHS